MDPTAYRTLFAWQGDAGGRAPELADAEVFTSTGEAPVGMSEEAKTWAERPDVRAWLALEPALAKEDLGDYYFFSRDRFSPALPAARLSPPLQTLLSALQAESDGDRAKAVDEAVALPPDDLAAVLAALLAASRSDRTGVALGTALKIAGASAPSAETLLAHFDTLPVGSVEVKWVPMLTTILKPSPALDALLAKWEAAGGLLGRAAARARAPKAAPAKAP